MYSRIRWGSLCFSLSLRIWTQPAAELICLLSLKKHSHATLSKFKLYPSFPLTLWSFLFPILYIGSAPCQTLPTSWISSLNQQHYSAISVINFSVFLWFKSVDPTVRKTRDNRWRQFTAGHKETLQGGHAERFLLGSFSAALLYSVAPVYRIMHQYQNFAIFCTYILSMTKYFWSITLSAVTDTSNSASGYRCFIYFIPEVPERNTLSRMVTYALEQLIPTETTNMWKKRL